MEANSHLHPTAARGRGGTSSGEGGAAPRSEGAAPPPGEAAPPPEGEAAAAAGGPPMPTWMGLPGAEVEEGKPEFALPTKILGII